MPLDARVLSVSHPVLLSVKDKQGRSRGFIRIEAFWVDEAKPRKETGEFYYKVWHPPFLQFFFFFFRRVATPLPIAISAQVVLLGVHVSGHGFFEIVHGFLCVAVCCDSQCPPE